MKKFFRFEVENKTGGSIHILPVDRTLLPRTREVFEAEFSKPLRMRLARLDHESPQVFNTSIDSAFQYRLKFKRRGLRYEWILKVKNGNHYDNVEPGQEPPQVSCVLSEADEEPPKNVEPGEPD